MIPFPKSLAKQLSHQIALLEKVSAGYDPRWNTEAIRRVMVNKGSYHVDSCDYILLKKDLQYLFLKRKWGIKVHYVPNGMGYMGGLYELYLGS